jgi:hypothetical protein
VEATNALSAFTGILGLDPLRAPIERKAPDDKSFIKSVVRRKRGFYVIYGTGAPVWTLSATGPSVKRDTLKGRVSLALRQGAWYLAPVEAQGVSQCLQIEWSSPKERSIS